MHNIEDLPTIKTHLQDHPVPERLYYYTDPGTLIQIIGTQAIWGGMPQQMNDGAELKHALTTLRRVADRVASGGQAPELVREFARYVCTGPSAELILNGRPAFLVSLSQKCDSLSQWRAYCARSGGVCLSLPGELVSHAAKRNKWTIGKCIYDTETAETMMRELLDHHASRFMAEAETRASQLDRAGYTTSLRLRRDYLVQLILDAQIYGSFIKNPSFVDEAEWRLLTVNPAVSRNKIEHAAGRDGVRAFLPFDFAEAYDEFDGLQPEIWIGPTATPGASDYATQTLLERWVGAGAVVHHTNSTFR